MKRLRKRAEEAERKVPVKGYWKRWGLFFITLGRIITKIPAMMRGARHKRVIERLQADEQRERLERILNPEKYQGK